MIEARIEFDKKRMEEIAKTLAGIKNGVEKAVPRAINRAASAANKQAAKMIKETYTVKNGRKGKIQEAAKGRLTGSIEFKGRRRLLTEFNHRRYKKGIAVAVYRSSSYKLIPGAFKRRLRKGDVNGEGALGMLIRIGRERYPLEALHGPSLPQMAGNKKIQPEITKTINKVLAERIEHEMNVLLKGIVK